MKKTTIFICVLLIFANQVPVFSQETFYHSKNGHFSFALPGGWIQIPDGILKEYIKTLRASSPLAAKAHYDAAFQKKNNEYYFASPRLLVKIDKKGRYDEEDVKRTSTAHETEKEMAKTARNLEKAYKGTIDSLNFGKFTYDEGKHALFMKTEGVTAKEGRIIAVTAVMLSDYGSVRLMFYSTADTFSENKIYFDRIINSFKFDKGHGY